MPSASAAFRRHAGLAVAGAAREQAIERLLGGLAMQMASVGQGQLGAWTPRKRFSTR